MMIPLYVGFVLTGLPIIVYAGVKTGSITVSPTIAPTNGVTLTITISPSTAATILPKSTLTFSAGKTTAQMFLIQPAATAVTGTSFTISYTIDGADKALFAVPTSNTITFAEQRKGYTYIYIYNTLVLISLIISSVPFYPMFYTSVV